jgi:hypothetical protein
MLEETGQMIAWIVSPACNSPAGFTFDPSGGRATYWRGDAQARLADGDRKSHLLRRVPHSILNDDGNHRESAKMTSTDIFVQCLPPRLC